MSHFKRNRRERGYAILLLMVLLGLGSTWMVVSAVSDASLRLADDRARNAVALKQAKEALIAWVGGKALAKDDDDPEVGERNPGRLPCPEAPGYYGGPSEGIAAGNCTLPAVGRLPWRTLGLDKLTDATGEPLWYVVSAGWALSNSTTPPLTTNINPGSLGQLTLDGEANAAVALIIAPGRILNVQSAAGCAPREQTRAAPGAPDPRDYLECENATSPADASFVSGGPAASFNDQVLRITVADVMPILEAAIAKRIERDIAPAMRKAYTTTQATIGSWYGWSSNAPHYPFAAPFGDPSTSNYIGSASPATYQGLLPMATTAANPGLVAWNTASSSAWHSWSYSGTVNWYDCMTWFSATELWCEVNYSGRPVFGFWAQAYNVGNVLREFNPAAALAAGAASLNWYEGYLDYDGSGWVYAEVMLPDHGVADGTHWFNLPIGLLADHSLLDPNHAATGWFVRNQWHRFSYYAVSEGFTPGWNSQCDTAGNPACLTVSTPATSLGGRRALLALAGRGLNGQTRPSAALADYLDSAANRDGNSAFEQKPVSATFNDRIVTVDANP
jgi:hypothetical protein